MIKLLFHWGGGIKVWHCEVLLVRTIHCSVGKKLIIFSSFFFAHTQRMLKRWHRMAHASLLNLIALNFTWVTLCEGVTTRWHRHWLCKHADKFLKHDITLVYIGSALAHTWYFSCLDHSAAVGMCTALCIPLLIEELAQWFQLLPCPRVASLRERGLNGAMGHGGNGVGQPVGRWEREKVKSPAFAEEVKQHTLNFWWAASIPCALGERSLSSPSRLAGSWLPVPLGVSALTQSVGWGGGGRAAGPLGSDTLWCCGGRRQERSLQDNGRTRRDLREQRCCFSITHLQQVGEISAAVGCYFPGPWVWRPGRVFHPKGDEYLDLGGVAQEQKPVCSLSSHSLRRAPKAVQEKQRNPFLKGNTSVTCQLFFQRWWKPSCFKPSFLHLPLLVSLLCSARSGLEAGNHPSFSCAQLCCF